MIHILGIQKTQGRRLIRERGLQVIRPRWLDGSRVVSRGREIRIRKNNFGRDYDAYSFRHVHFKVLTEYLRWMSYKPLKT